MAIPPSGDWSPQGIQSRIIAEGTPLFRQGAQAVRQATAAAGRRKGVFGAADISRRVTEPLAPALGQLALRAGQEGERLGAQFESQARALEFSREELAQRKAIEDQRIAEMMAQRQQTGQLAMFPHTGFTQEMLQSLGYPGTPREPFGPQFELGQFQRSLEDMQRRDQLPGIPFGQGPLASRGGLNARDQMMLSRMYPGSTRGYRMQMAQNLGLMGGPIQPGQFRR